MNIDICIVNLLSSALAVYAFRPLMSVEGPSAGHKDAPNDILSEEGRRH